MNENYHLDKWYNPPLEFEGIRVAQIGKLYCNNRTVIETHRHSELFELTIVTDGLGIITTNGFPIPVQSGDIYLSLPGDTHKIESDAEQLLKFDFFAFTCDIEYLRCELEKIADTFCSPTARVFKNKQIRLLLGNAIAELTNERKYSQELLASLFRQVVILIIREFSDIKSENHPDTVMNAEILCYKLMNYIDTNIYSLKTLTELGKITDYSYGYISSVFKKTTHDTLSNYYRKRKLETAAMLILENRLKLYEIAEHLGYSSAYALSKAFTEFFGESPRAYRNKHK